MGLVFLAAPAFTIAVAAVSGPLTDRIGPRIPASIGVSLSIASFLVGGALSIGSSWVLLSLERAGGGGGLVVR
jgi:MFS family permease